MRLCSSCHSVNADENVFCESCGTPLKEKRLCPGCGTQCSEEATFCHKCGRSLRGGTSVPAPGAVASNPLTRPLLLGAAGAVLALVGVFMPFIRVPLLGGVSYLRLDSTKGLLVVAAAVLGGGALIARVYSFSMLSAIGAAGLTGYDLYDAISSIERAKGGDNVENIGEAIASVSQIAPGGIVIVLGAVLLFVASVWAADLEKRQKAAGGDG
jgi:hypothetical protein